MPLSVPELSLSHGQLLWSLSLGHEPTEEVKDKVRYLRQLGIPRPKVGGSGKGHHLIYDFDDLALTGFGMLGLSAGFKPRELVKYLVELRSEMVKAFHTIWIEQNEDLLSQPWVKSRGAKMVMREEPSYLRLHGRARGAMAGIELTKGEGTASSPHMIPYEVIPGEKPEVIFEIDYWLPQWVAWALEAPAPSRGRKPASQSN